MNIFDTLLAAKMAGGSAPAPVLIDKSITANGSYQASADEADGYSAVTVQVPNSYSVGDEGKVVQSGALVAQTATSASTNGTVDTTTNNSIIINVPNSYAAGDEGKVVHNGALVSQTSTSVNTNGVIDTTLHDSVTVQVPEGAKMLQVDYNVEVLEPICVQIGNDIIISHRFKYSNPVTATIRNPEIPEGSTLSVLFSFDLWYNEIRNDSETSNSEITSDGDIKVYFRNTNSGTQSEDYKYYRVARIRIIPPV